MTTVTPDGFEAAITAMVEEHIGEIRNETGTAVRAAGKASADHLKANSPRRTGKYAAGWASTVQGNNLEGYTAYVHNTTKPSLTHLLEFGHGLVYMGHPTGRRVPPYPHIEQGFEAGASELHRRLGA